MHVNRLLSLRQAFRSLATGYLGLDHVPDQAPRALHERQLVRQAAFQQHADPVMAGQIRRPCKDHILPDAKVGEMGQFRQDEQVLGNG